MFVCMLTSPPPFMGTKQRGPGGTQKTPRENEIEKF